jgi:hypothetical protein
MLCTPAYDFRNQHAAAGCPEALVDENGKE